MMSTRARSTLMAIAFLTVLTLAFVALWLTFQRRYLQGEQAKRVHVATDLIAEAGEMSLSEGNVLRLAYMADRVAAAGQISRVMIADRTGAIIVDSAHSAYGTRPPIVLRALQTDRTIIEASPSRWIATEAITTEVGQTIGCVWTEFPTAALRGAQRRALLVALLLAGLGILVGSVLSFLFADYVTRPLGRLLGGIRQLQSGESTEPIPPLRATRELDEIGRAFNEMAGVIQERVRRLELLNQMAASLPVASDLEDAAFIIRGAVASIMDARSYLWIADPLSRELAPVVAADEQELVGEPVGATCNCAVARAFANRRLIIIGAHEADLPSGSPLVHDFRVASALVLPLVTYDGIAGVLAVVRAGRRTFVSNEDIALVSAIGNVVAPVIMARLRAEAQARSAAALQSLLVPTDIPEIGVDISAIYVPAEEITGLGGDYYDIVPLGGSRWAVIIGDASGKGLEASRLTTNAKYVIRSYMLEYGDPAQAMRWSNRALVFQGEPGRFITVFAVSLDVAAGDVRYANAGHTWPVLYRRETGEISFLEVEGMAMGVALEAEFADGQAVLHSGDILCLYTDGITEARHDHEWFGEQRIADAIKECAAKSAEEIRDHIISQVHAFVGNGFKDDVVLLVLKMP